MYWRLMIWGDEGSQPVILILYLPAVAKEAGKLSLPIPVIANRIKGP